MRTEHRRVNFVAPYADDEQPPAAIEAQPLQPADISAVWMPTTSPTRDSVSAQDRAKGYLLRQAPLYATTVLMASMGTVGYSLIAWGSGIQGAPYAGDKVLVFLATLTIALLVTHTRTNQQDLDHSHAGVERKRIDAAVEIRAAELRAQSEIAQAALAAQLRMLEMRHGDAGHTERARLSDRGTK